MKHVIRLMLKDFGRGFDSRQVHHRRFSAAWNG